MQKTFMDIYKAKRYNIGKKQTAGVVILQLALKIQKGNNFPVIPIISGFTFT